MLMSTYATCNSLNTAHTSSVIHESRGWIKQRTHHNFTDRHIVRVTIAILTNIYYYHVHIRALSWLFRLITCACLYTPYLFISYELFLWLINISYFWYVSYENLKVISTHWRWVGLTFKYIRIHTSDTLHGIYVFGPLFYVLWNVKLKSSLALKSWGNFRRFQPSN